jgi:hypothetical protein
MYRHMEPLLRSLHRNEETMHTRQIKPGENVRSIWDTVMDERSEFRLFDISGRKVTCRTDVDIAGSPYLLYNEANAAEDAILFPDEINSDKKTVAFREIRNGVSDIEVGVLPSEARNFAKGLAAINKGKDPIKAIRSAKDQDEERIWGLPKVWETGLKQARHDKPTKAQRLLLQRAGLLSAHKSLSFDQRLDFSDPMELMERDRAFSKYVVCVSIKTNIHQVSRSPSTLAILSRVTMQSTSNCKIDSVLCFKPPTLAQRTGFGTSPRFSTGLKYEATTTIMPRTLLHHGHILSLCRI